MQTIHQYVLCIILIYIVLISILTSLTSTERTFEGCMVEVCNISIGENLKSFMLEKTIHPNGSSHALTKKGPIRNTLEKFENGVFTLKGRRPSSICV